MTIGEGGAQADDLLRKHYEQTVANFGAINSDNLHFMGYFENPNDSLVTALQQINRHFLTKLALGPNDRMLDVGCGTGGPSCYLAQASGCRVVGVDLGDVQVGVARQLAEERGLSDRVTFKVEDATRLSFDANTFDAVVLMGSASHMPAKDAVLTECARVLRPGGRLVLGDMVIAKPEWFRDRANSAKVRIINLFFANPHLGTRQDYEGLLRNCGFEIQDSETLPQHLERSGVLWQQTLAEQKDELTAKLGANHFRAMSSAIQSIQASVSAGAFDAVVLTATKRQ